MAAFDYFLSLTGDCTNTNSGAILLELSGGTPPYSIEFINPYIDSTPYVAITEPVLITNLEATTYGVRVNDSTAPDNLEFYLNIPISSGVCASILSTINSTCGGSNGSVTGTTTSLFSTTDCYLYTSGNTLISNNIFNSEEIIFENLSADTYYIYVEDIGGCTAKTENFIIKNSASFDYGYYIVKDSPCFTGSTGAIYITGQTNPGPYSYFWSNGATGNTITNLATDSYSVSVTDGQGCVNTKIIIVEEAEPMGLLQIIPTQPSCFTATGSLDITISGGTIPYYFSASTGFYDITYSNNIVITGLTSGTYDIRVTDGALCSLDIATSLVSENSVSSVEIIGTNSLCGSSNGIISINILGGTGPYTYGLILPSGNTITNTTTSTNYLFTNLETGTYTVYMQDSSGCYYDEEVIIIAEDKFELNYSLTGTTCNSNNGSLFVYITTGGTPPYDFYLDDVNSILDTNLTGYTFTNLRDGNKTLRVIDSTGCEQIKVLTIPTSNYLDFSLYPTSCVNGNDGTITALITDGLPPFTYTWSSNVSGNPQSISATGLTRGDYSLTIIDNNGCSLTRNTSISCFSTVKSYQTYIVDSKIFGTNSITKFGIVEILNDGYEELLNLTYGEETPSSLIDCKLNSAIFTLQFELNPSGYTGTTSFYTGYTRTDVPTDSVYVETIKYFLENNISGISDVSYDLVSNTLNIITEPNDGITSQVLTIKLKIDYDISCKS